MFVPSFSSELYEPSLVRNPKHRATLSLVIRYQSNYLMLAYGYSILVWLRAYRLSTLSNIGR